MSPGVASLSLLVSKAETKNDIFLCWLTSSSSSLKTKEHLKVAGWRHIFVLKNVYSKEHAGLLSFFFFFHFYWSFRLDMSDHYSANANLSGWMWILKP